ncbi:MAG TPA: hypothetical protein PLJ27_02225 [Polyangiaceae bacterium]|jgi:hypothetical protein|nr:MAG: hypothetical protein BWY17_02708 [Deltaproteobacteria bacterium ADurb.Bin207]HNZ24140.1 hypothetical protein [Polyangiaceae bacterium]HOD23805.1 hypothetical protein [Polyangiaceae bacterium]HOE48768.1 hypothetical protein [Polyangiaceae bacterium]HOH02178.1 hypothetical protein [Polyangiaceae bacterium]
MALSIFRTTIVFATLLVVLGWVRVATAYAPFCDPRAATGVAFPPFTVIPDLRWEPSFEVFFLQSCERMPAYRSVEGIPHPAKDKMSEMQSGHGMDLAALSNSVDIPRRFRPTRVALSGQRTPNLQEILHRVYRPPKHL